MQPARADCGLSIVAIGRNEEQNIPALIRSINRLRRRTASDVEAIYVDSASSDRSVQLASEGFDLIAELAANGGRLCAAAGRRVGAEYASGRWIFFVDADMEICEDFAQEIEDLLSCAGDTVALVGSYVHVFPDGETQRQLWIPRVRDGFRRAFGGAVVIRKEALLSVGNWDASICSHEELQLCLRLIAAGGTVRAVGRDMVIHRTERFRSSEVVRRLFLPWGGLGLKYLGFGQMMSAVLREPRLIRTWVRVEPLFAAFVTCIVVAAVASALGEWLFGFVLFAGVCGALAWLAGVGRVLVYLSRLVQVWAGLLKYKPHQEPSIVNVMKGMS
jgi:glycosyltransferase involved in cell wall biosynthesis